jgi:glucosyl-dolichyl phosphate glucuronosyltransferase
MLGHLSIVDLGDEIKEISPYCVFGCNFSIRKDILLEAGGFHPDGMPKELIKYRGDGESYVSKYIQESDYRTIYNPKASVYHLCSTNRMSKEYFIKRSYSQGVSDSYTNIRENVKMGIFKNKLKFLIKKYILRRDAAIDYGYLCGYIYHQNEVKKDQALLEWVRRGGYINNGTIK